MTTPIQIKINPRADKRKVLDALLGAMDLCGEQGDLAKPIREYVRGRCSKDNLLEAVAARAQRGCQQAPQIGVALNKAEVQMPLPVAELVNTAVAQSLADLGFVLIALASMKVEDPRFIEIAEAAVRALRGAVATLGGPVQVIDIMMQRACVIEESQDDIGRNKPCTCGSGKKYKLCCVAKGP